MRRNVDVLVLSDLHLGTYGCKATECLNYLNSVDPQKVILNGDIIDIWNFKKSYFPDKHMEILKIFMEWSATRPVYYITGNHDDALRKYSDVSIGNLHLIDELEITINGDRYWFFHGDIFDASMNYAKWLAKMGGFGYDLLIRSNNGLNWMLNKLGRPKMSFSKKIKNSVKKAVKYISDFELTAAEVAIERNFDYVVCGHIHQPKLKSVSTEQGDINYLNSGDWVENLTALEYQMGKWTLHQYEDQEYAELEMIARWKRQQLERVSA